MNMCASCSRKRHIILKNALFSLFPLSPPSLSFSLPSLLSLFRLLSAYLILCPTLLFLIYCYILQLSFKPRSSYGRIARSSTLSVGTKTNCQLPETVLSRTGSRGRLLTTSWPRVSALLKLIHRRLDENICGYPASGSAIFSSLPP
jgi:hypothetical protein